jgi:hypothetical protein
MKSNRPEPTKVEGTHAVLPCQRLDRPILRGVKTFEQTPMEIVKRRILEGSHRAEPQCRS